MNYQTQSGIEISVNQTEIDYAQAVEFLMDELNTQRGALYSSNFEYPGRYTRWDVGFINPPLVITAKELNFKIEALNQRGQVLLLPILKVLNSLEAVAHLKNTKDYLSGEIVVTHEREPEELRSKRPTIFSVIRSIIDLFKSTEDDNLGLYGVFGYDLVFQFENLCKKLKRTPDQRDLVLYLPDELYIVDHRRETAMRKQYEFVVGGKSTTGIERTGEKISYRSSEKTQQLADHFPGEYAQIVKLAKEKFKRGDLFEVVPGQTFFEDCPDNPAEIYRRLRERNPSPYGFIINLGDSEYLVGASPEMYVRVTGKRVETCPISGTIKRGVDAMDDAEKILELLNSKKDESELTMCSDVDRNDKSRICEAGSVKVIGRRQIELYSRVIHTVDHIEGFLRDGYDALDAFLSHMWVVTVTGAPKIWAMQFLEDHEKSSRRWYGGAVGWLGFNGNINTGLTLRTIRIKQGVAEIRAGATLLYDSDPAAEEQEIQLKAAAFIDAIKTPRDTQKVSTQFLIPPHSSRKKVFLVDHQDSFVHTLANYFRQTGAKITTYRYDFSEEDLKTVQPDFLVLSPGPGRPSDFNTARTLSLALKYDLPIFGVCLGLQALVEYFGGKLNVLDYPQHGKPATITHNNQSRLFIDIPQNFTIGRYHSLYADKNLLPKELTVTAETHDGIIMALEHKTLPLYAVQFHPESILSLNNNVGLTLISNCVKILT